MTCPYCAKGLDKAEPICCEWMRVLAESYIDIIYEKFEELKNSGALKPINLSSAAPDPAPHAERSESTTCPQAPTQDRERDSNDK